ncbi:hypothetical protein [Streptomyces sp. NBC_00268]|nr:hypothetical protein [Streptomyces sp. NBC_00268]MCX5182839.1 hypothetical protein [Streptomyces sp. NBC_00268]
MLGLLLLPTIVGFFLVVGGFGEFLFKYPPISVSASLFGRGFADRPWWVLLCWLAGITAAMLGGAYAAGLKRDV